MLPILRLPLAIALTLSRALVGCGSGADLRDTSILLGRIDQFGFQKTSEHQSGELAGQVDFKNEDLSNGPAYAAGQLILDAIRETGATDGARLAAALEAGPHATVMGSLSCMRDDHLPSGPWYFYEYPNREPKLLEQVKPVYVPEYDQQ